MFWNFYQYLAIGLIAMPGMIAISGYIVTEVPSYGIHIRSLHISLLLVFLTFAVASPISGVFGLLSLAVSHRRSSQPLSDEQKKLRSKIFLLSIIQILVAGLWILAFPYVFFATGNTR